MIKRQLMCVCALGLSDLAIILVSIAVGFMIIQGFVVSIYLCYKNKRIKRKHKILQFSVYQRSSMIMRPISPIPSNQHLPLLPIADVNSGSAGSTSNDNTNVYNYNRDRWEIKKDRLMIDKNDVLGIGATGEVFKGEKESIYD